MRRASAASEIASGSDRAVWLLMLIIRTAVLILALAFGTTACRIYGRVGGQVVASSDPVLVELYPGVWVIEDYDDPVFYADGFYWWYRDDGWYRSHYHTGGWVFSSPTPRAPGSSPPSRPIRCSVAAVAVSAGGSAGG